MVTIALDAGHWYHEAGRRCWKQFDPKETREWTLNDRVISRVETMLAEYEGVKTVRVDDRTGQTFIGVNQRATSANNAKADIYISQHHNADIRGGSGGGLVVIRRKGSKKSLSSKALYDAILNRTGLKGNRSEPLEERDNLAVLKNTNMEAYLIEGGFMDSSTDVPTITTDTYAQNAAQGIVDFLVAKYSLKKKVVPVPVKDYLLPDGKFFRVVVGSYQSRNNAEDVQRRLKEAGFDSFLAIYEK